MKYDDRLEITKSRSYQVVKANEIIQKARYELNLTELKALAYILSMVKPNDRERTIYSLSVREYCRICGINDTSGRNYEIVKSSLKKLRDTSFYLMQEDGTEVSVGWLDKVWINKGSGKIRVRFDEDLEKYIMGLIGNYTQYELLCTLPMRSQYSFRLYELLKSYAFAGKHTFDIDTLKTLLNATTYKNFKDFRIKVLKISMEEINLYTDIEVNYEPVYKGRKVIQVKFDITQRDAWGRNENSIRATAALDGQMNIYDFIED